MPFKVDKRKNMVGYKIDRLWEFSKKEVDERMHSRGAHSAKAQKE